MRLPCGDAGAAAPLLWGSQACCTSALAVEAGNWPCFSRPAQMPQEGRLVLQWVLGASAALPLLGALFGEASAASPRMDGCETKPDLPQPKLAAAQAKSGLHTPPARLPKQALRAQKVAIYDS